MVKKNMYKFWWNDELDDLKGSAVDAHREWLRAGRPRQGPIFELKQRTRLRYRQMIRSSESQAVNYFTNDLNDALQRKNGVAFWRAWKAKMGSNKNDLVVNGKRDPREVAEDFETFFADQSAGRHSEKSFYLGKTTKAKLNEYVGAPCNPIEVFTVEDVSHSIDALKRGKAPGLDGITAEHVKFAHPCVVTIVTRLYNLMLCAAYVPSSFRSSYIVPIVKGDATGKALQCSDFRGISINSVFSKVFEKSLLRVFDEFFVTAENQFGFKSGVGCPHAIGAVRTIVNSFINGGSTANLCALDVSRAFPSVDHNLLFAKLMELNLPKCVVDVIVNWYNNCQSCVHWNGASSKFFVVHCGVMQGSCLAPILFAIYINSIIVQCNRSGLGYIIVYADDIILITRSVTALQKLVDIVDAGLSNLELSLNIAKSFCLRIGQRFGLPCTSIVVKSQCIEWSTMIRYLGVYLLAGKSFKVSHETAKRNFNRCANAIVSRIGTSCDVAVLSHLISAKCVPALLFGLEACEVNKSSLSSLDFVFMRFYFKAFRTSSRQVVDDSLMFLGIQKPSALVKKRSEAFESKFMNSQNMFCKHIVVLGRFRSYGCTTFCNEIWTPYRTVGV
jgi:hypothetical protein